MTLHHPRRIEPGPGQESVWDYPRPPRLERSTKRLVITFADAVVADTTGAYRVLETSQAPSYYLPPDDIDRSLLVAAPGSSFCEWKGMARYWSVVVGDRVAAEAAWSYPAPTPPFQAIADHVAFYPGRLDRCTVDGEQARPMDGGFYGGWITDDIVGPIKGAPGTLHW